MATDREELERRAARAVCTEVFGDPDVADDVVTESSLRAARAVLGAFGLTEETVWTDDGDPEVQRNTPEFTLDDPTMEQEDFVDEFFRKHGWKLKRRWVTEWTEVTDDD